MQTVTVELIKANSLAVLNDLEHKHLIRILKEPEFNSYALPGKPMNTEDFIKWVEFAESSPAVSITEAKQRWAKQREKLQKHIR